VPLASLPDTFVVARLFVPVWRFMDGEGPWTIHAEEASAASFSPISLALVCLLEGNWLVCCKRFRGPVGGIPLGHSFSSLAPV
jgi:hypothetical protein